MRKYKYLTTIHRSRGEWYLLITSGLTNLSARKALFTCVVYTKRYYLMPGPPSIKKLLEVYNLEPKNIQIGLQSKNNEPRSQVETGKRVTLPCAHNKWTSYNPIQNTVTLFKKKLKKPRTGRGWMGLTVPSAFPKSAHNTHTYKHDLLTNKDKHSHYRFQDVTANINIANMLDIKSFEMSLYIQVKSWIWKNTNITLSVNLLQRWLQYRYVKKIRKQGL